MADIERTVKDAEKITDKSLANSKWTVEEVKKEALKNAKKVKYKTKYNLEEHIKDVKGTAGKHFEAAQEKTVKLAYKAKDVGANNNGEDSTE